MNCISGSKYPIKQSSWSVLGPGPWLSQDLGRRLEKKAPHTPGQVLGSWAQAAGRSRAGSRGSSPPSAPPTAIVLPSPPEGSLCLHALPHQWPPDARVRGGSSLGVRIEKGQAVSGEGGAAPRLTHHSFTRVSMLRSFCQVPASGELVLTRSLRLSVTITFY